MNERRRNVLVGLFVFVGLVALGTLVVLFGQGPQWLLAGDTYPIIVRFDSVSGIREGSPVTVRGKRIGHVQAVGFADGRLAGRVEVTLAIDNEYLGQIPRDSRASTIAAGLLGGGRPPIDIELGVALAALEPGDSIPGSTRGALDALVPEDMVATLDRTARQIGNAAEALEPVLRDLDELLAPRTPADVDRIGGPAGNLASAAGRLDALLRHVNDILGSDEEQNRLKETIANIYELSDEIRVLVGQFQETTENAQGLIQRTDEAVGNIDAAVAATDARIEAIAGALLGDLEQAGVVLRNLTDVTATIKAGEGTLGRLVNDDELFEVLVLSTRRLAETLEEVRLLVIEWQQGRIRVGL